MIDGRMIAAHFEWLHREFPLLFALAENAWDWDVRHSDVQHWGRTAQADDEVER